MSPGLVIVRLFYRCRFAKGERCQIEGAYGVELAHLGRRAFVVAPWTPRSL
jgi:hypothetical protein